MGKHWSLNLNLAVRSLWHAAETRGFKGDSIDPKHVALTAATYFSRDTEALIDELAKYVVTD